MNVYFQTDNNGTDYGFDFSWDCAPNQSESIRIDLDEVFQLFSDDHTSSLGRNMNSFKPEVRPEMTQKENIDIDFGSVANQAVKNVLNISQKSKMSTEELESINGSEEKLARLIDQIAKGNHNQHLITCSSIY